MAYKIEKNVPIPKIAKNQTGLSATMRSLEVGDSFVLKNKATTRAQVYHIAKHIGIKISTRAEGVEGNLRCWRVAKPETPEDQPDTGD